MITWKSEHGFECLNTAYKAEPGNSFNLALDACFPGLAEDLKNYFNAWLPGIRRDTYMTCVSEHSAEEDRHGRLSMWRAYGGQAGVALVLNGAVMFSESNALGAYASPVAYLNPDAFAAEFVKIAKSIEGEAEYIRSLGREIAKDIAFNMLRFAVLCTKHPGFPRGARMADRCVARNASIEAPCLNCRSRSRHASDGAKDRPTESS
ncbi:MAG TPA: DUF2971 domain-containing protein [Candidatus Binatia bacterium]|jgi:hypothetical protein|nr:DUF2971 domain-containing protein [Candidatus Binatia bacterium]